MYDIFFEGRHSQRYPQGGGDGSLIQSLSGVIKVNAFTSLFSRN